MDEPKPDSIAEEVKRLRESWAASSRTDSVEPPPEGEPASTELYWTLPQPEPPPTGRWIGWLLAIIGIGVIAGFGIYLGLPESSDPGDGGWADIGFFISPFFAFAAGMAVAFVLWSVARLRLADIPVSQARAAAVGGGCLGPIVYFAAIVVGGGWFDAMLLQGRGYVLIFTIPILCGVALAVGAVVARYVRGRLGSNRT